MMTDSCFCENRDVRRNRFGAVYCKNCGKFVDEQQTYIVEYTGSPGAWVTTFQCPTCRGRGEIDEDQFYGKVSIECPCGFHQTINLHETI